MALYVSRMGDPSTGEGSHLAWSGPNPFLLLFSLWVCVKLSLGSLSIEDIENGGGVSGDDDDETQSATR